MTVWDSLGGGELHFSAHELGRDVLGYIIENSAIANALNEAQEPRWQRCVHDPKPCTKLPRMLSRMRTTSPLCQSLSVGGRCRFLVKSNTALALQQRDYDQQAITARLSCAVPTLSRGFTVVFTGRSRWLPFLCPILTTFLWYGRMSNVSCLER